MKALLLSHKFFLSILVLGLWIRPQAAAQQQKGDKEIQFSATYFSFSGTSFGIAQGRYGMYFTDRIGAAVSPIIIFGDVSSFGMGLSGSYSFLLSDAKTVPYAGAQLLMPDLSVSDTYGFGVQGGVKRYITERVTADGNVNVLIPFAGGGAITYVAIGLGLVFR